MTSYLTYMDTISLSRTVFEIFDFKVLRVWPWPLTPKGHLGSKKLYHSKGHIWLPIWFLWTLSLYLVPFSRYSTSKFLGFDLDLWPQKVIWGIKKKNNTIRKAMYDFLFDLYGHHLSISYRFWDIRLQGFKGLTLIFDPKRSSGVQKNYTIRKAIYDFLFDFYGHYLSISYRFSRYSTSKFLGFDLDLWPLKVIWGQKKIIPFERPCMTSYLTYMDTIALSRTVLEIMPVKILKDEQNGGFWLFKGQGQKSIFL